MWDPDVYLGFADHRARPFHDLLTRVGARDPHRVVDLGCGPGNLTGGLARRWPDAVIEAVDSSPEMVAAACARGVNASVADVRTWTPQPDTAVVVSNAVMHWVPEHRELFVRWASQLAAGSWLAIQMPANFDAPSHAAVRAVAGRGTFGELLRDMPCQRGAVVDAPSRYAELLVDAGCAVDAWETTYIHQLAGEQPVLNWISGSTLTAVEERLNEHDYQRFRQELSPLLAEAYPARSDGTTLYPFRRVFFTAQVGG